MAQENRNNPLSEWLLLFRRQAPILRQAFDEWVEEVRGEPRLIWETPAVSYSTYCVGGLLLLWIVAGVANTVAPPKPPDAGPAATTADFHVVCSNERCRHHFVVNKKFGFRGFPVTCTKCGQETGMQARKCNSAACFGRWIIPEKVGNMLKCPHCGDQLR
ncbi:MAG: hypothetical protein JSU63_02430 [Phycisphaerales bacterium]|nr:MAG: hypothetical protein JSU63_02430 [Phycisphaerales bacterium]